MITQIKKRRLHRFLSQSSNLCNLFLKICVIVFFTFITNHQLRITNYELSAQEDLEQLKQDYFNQHRYSEFVDYLKAIRKDRRALVSYYIALSRYEQLKYLEEAQNWEEYFNRADPYRQEFISEAQNALELTSKEEPLFVYARCLLWQFHKDMRDDREGEALGDLQSALKQHSESFGVDLSAIKYVADKLSDYGDRINSQKVYKIYLEKLVTSLEENKEIKLISLAKELAFAESGQGNPFFAEEVFKKLEQIHPDFILDEQTQYLRAYNLEKLKQYEDARKHYEILVKNYPQASRYKEVIFKIGVISAYTLGDIPAALDYFTQLVQTSSSDPQILAGYYQLGLISQYQGKLSSAKSYYNALLEKAEEIFCDESLADKAAARLKEIEENQPFDFNLKVFMDILEPGPVGMPGVDIKAQYFKLTPGQKVRLSSVTLPAESGCFPVNLEYFWSGDLGSESPGSGQNSFITGYSCVGTKLVQLTVITPSGILGRDFIFLDVTEGR